MRQADLFALVKSNVTPRQAAERYGLVINRSGFAVCPFHAEKTGSLKFFGNGTAHCFGACGRNYDAVDIASVLTGLKALDAAKLICADFGLDPCVAPERRPEGTETPYQRQKRKQAEETRRYALLCEREQPSHALLARYNPETSEGSSVFTAALKEFSYVQDRLNNMGQEVLK